MPAFVGSSWVEAEAGELDNLVPLQHAKLATLLDERQQLHKDDLVALNVPGLTVNSVVRTPSGRQMRPTAGRARTVSQWENVLRKMDDVGDDSDSEGDSWDGVTMQQLRKNARKNLERAASLLPLDKLPADLRDAHEKATQRYGASATLPFAET